MTDPQVLIFGSFTEDEIKSIQCHPPSNDANFTFGSLDSETLKSVGFFNTRETELDSSNGCKLSTPTILPNGFRVDSRTTTGSNVKVGFPKENGDTSVKCTADSLANKLNGGLVERSAPLSYEVAHNVSNRSTLEQPFINSVIGLSSSLKDVLCNTADGVQEVDSNENIFKQSSRPNDMPRNFLPRGLVNLGNLCFLNATLQALLSCSPFFNLLNELKNRDIPEIGYPTLRAFVEFISDFDMLTDSNCKSSEKTVLETGKPFRPIMFDSILKSFTPDIPDNLSGRPRQEDAQEFLSFVMHQMHDELLKLDGQVANGNGKAASLVSSTDDESEDENWETLGPRNKAAVTRTQSFIPSKLSAIFGGQLRSVVNAKGNKDSATIQPFLLLHLNIFPEPVCTIEDALQLFSEPETLEGYKTSAAGKAEVVTASKSIKIQELSDIMVLHLMRFSYGSQGSTKLHKTVHFPLDLVVGHELLASPPAEGKKYELVATITHHGRDPSKGHYTADARHPNGKWLRYDDASVTVIPESKVLHDQAYVLFYKQL